MLAVGSQSVVTGDVFLSHYLLVFGCAGLLCCMQVFSSCRGRGLLLRGASVQRLSCEAPAPEHGGFRSFAHSG